MGWQRKVVRVDQAEQDALRPTRKIEREPTPVEERAETGPGLLADARLGHPANAGRRAALLQAGQAALGNRAMLRALQDQALPAPVQRQEQEEELLQMQRQEEDEEEEMLQMQRQEQDEEEEMQPQAQQRALQASLAISAPGDECEREAERVADAVVQIAASPQVAGPPDTALLQGPLMRQGEAAGATVPEAVEQAIARRRGGGQLLDTATQGTMSRLLGHDFSAVRVHTDAAADMLNRQVSARAFTVGQDVFFRAGSYQPDTPAGQRLLAHELTHVVQQGAAGRAGAAGRLDERLSRAPADGPSKGPESAAPAPKEQEALAKDLITALQGKKPEEKDQGSEAVKKAIEAFLETPTGKRIKQQALGFALGSKGLPFTLLVGSAALAAMVASNTSIPSVPDIPISESMSLQFGFQGTFQKPTGFTIGLKIALGGKSQPVEKQTPPAAELPAWSPGQKIPADLLQKWIIGLAYHEYEMAGPDEEEDCRKFYLQLKEDPDTVPDARLLAEALGRNILSKSVKGERRVDLDLQHEDLWREAYKRFDRVKEFRPGLVARLRYILDAVVAELPESARGLEQVTFACAGRLLPMGVVKQAAKAR